VRPIQRVLQTTLRDLMFESNAADEDVLRLLRAISPTSPIIRRETYDSGPALLSLILATCTLIIGLVGLTGVVDNENVYGIVSVGGAAWWLLTGVELLRRPLRRVWRLLNWRFSIAWERFLFPNVADRPARVTIQVMAQDCTAGPRILPITMAAPRFPAADPEPAQRTQAASPRKIIIWHGPSQVVVNGGGPLTSQMRRPQCPK
jgi:hypothetical protein